MMIEQDHFDVAAEIESHSLTLEEEKAQRKRPNITHLSLAVDDEGHFVLGVGEKVVVEKVSSPIKGISHWLDTSVYLIKEYNEDTGDMKLWNEEFGGFLKLNYLDAISAGYSFRIPPGRGPFIKRKSRGRAPRPQTQTVVDPNAPPKVPGTGRRGRPKGSKNRAKETITAEKVARKEARAAKRMKK